MPLSKNFHLAKIHVNEHSFHEKYKNLPGYSNIPGRVTLDIELKVILLLGPILEI